MFITKVCISLRKQIKFNIMKEIQSCLSLLANMTEYGVKGKQVKENVLTIKTK